MTTRRTVNVRALAKGHKLPEVCGWRPREPVSWYSLGTIWVSGCSLAVQMLRKQKARKVQAKAIANAKAAAEVKVVREQNAKAAAKAEAAAKESVVAEVKAVWEQKAIAKAAARRAALAEAKAVAKAEVAAEESVVADGKELVSVNRGSPARGLDDDFQNESELWIDYVADVGDGFHGGFTVLHAIADDDTPGKRGSLLVLGGDQVYPVPTDPDYRDRLYGPIQSIDDRAVNATRKLLSIPGNHDYYDDLEAYRKVLLNQESVGAYKTQNTATHWVVRLPYDWLLVGLDFGEHEVFDAEQREHVLTCIEAAHQSFPGNGLKCVLVVATPAWLYGDGHPAAKSLIEAERAIGAIASIEMVIAGDRHCYLRHEFAEERSTQPAVRLTAGNGGSFLHLPKAEPEMPIFNGDQYVRKRLYPNLAFRDRFGLTHPVNFLFKNVTFMMIAAVLSAVVGGVWISASEAKSGVGIGWRELLNESLLSTRVASGAWRLDAPGRVDVMLLILVIVGALAVLPPPDVRGLSRLAWKTVFGVLFMVLFAIAVLLATLVASWIFDSKPAVALLAGVGGSVLGTLAVGALLWVLAFAGVSSTAVYGGASRHDSRSWLRLCVSARGLEVCAMGIDKTCVEWNVSGESGPVVPGIDKVIKPEPIDTFTLPGGGEVKPGPLPWGTVA